jgi:hypothetical protein
MFSELQTPCPRCGKPRAEWVEEGGEGVMFGAQIYCSDACAEHDSRPDSSYEADAVPEQMEAPTRQS